MFPQNYYAKVSDNKDPDSLNRIRVALQGEEESVSDWIPVITPYAGSECGLSFLPEIDDEVLIVALDGHNADKVAIGSPWTANAKPPKTGENGDADLNGDGKNSLHFLKSRSGSMFIFDDTDGKEKIQLISSDNKSRLEFNVPDKLVNLKTENDLTIGAKGLITIKAEEISITSKKQMNVSGDEIQVKAKKTLSITADQDITLKGSGIALN